MDVRRALRGVLTGFSELDSVLYGDGSAFSVRSVYVDCRIWRVALVLDCPEAISDLRRIFQEVLVHIGFHPCDLKRCRIIALDPCHLERLLNIPPNPFVRARPRGCDYRVTVGKRGCDTATGRLPV